MSILETMTKSERTALAMLERRDAREKIRLSGILGDCITLAADWTNTGSMAWFYIPTIEAGRAVTAAARAGGFRVVRLFATPPDAHAMPFTATVETEPMELDGPRNLAHRFQQLLTDCFGLQTPAVCSWIGGRFYLCIDSASDAAELERLNNSGVLNVARVRSEDLACDHFHVSIPTGAAIAYRKKSDSAVY